jgi:hypothetical protein
MKFQITSAGFAAAFAASNQGPRIEIDEFRIGAAFGYEPVPGDEGIRGVMLHTGVPVGYKVLDANTAEFLLTMDENVGTFNFGEIGLYMDGVLLALGALQLPQQKIAYPNSDFNRYKVKVRIVLTGVQPIVTLAVEELTLGVIYELPSVEYLERPAAAGSNIYLCHSADEVDNHALCVQSGTRWTISSHTNRAAVGSVSAVDGTGHYIDIVQASLPLAIVPGRYLVQFLSGIAQGQVRILDAFASGRVSWLMPILGVAVGDDFEIIQSNVSVRSDASDEAFFYSLLGS